MCIEIQASLTLLLILIRTISNSPIIVGRSNFLKLMLILRMVIYAGHVNFQPTLNFLAKKIGWATFTNFREKYFGVNDFT